ncbi:hypothetical protein [Micromonospora sp. A200]|uniref:hypothetical protein n=1 Tax=Micromonospora sp. A200 TaxID=2940568 RepID=UPI0024746972|nr:hypothetical protein [Micromonospora sp. A200]
MTDTLGIEREAQDRGTQGTARLLGWFSLGLGVAALGARQRVSRLCGIDDSRTAQTVLQVAGVREVGHAAARDPAVRFHGGPSLSTDPGGRQRLRRAPSGLPSERVISPASITCLNRRRSSQTGDREAHDHPVADPQTIPYALAGAASSRLHNAREPAVGTEVISAWRTPRSLDGSSLHMALIGLADSDRQRRLVRQAAAALP